MCQATKLHEQVSKTALDNDTCWYNECISLHIDKMRVFISEE